MEQEYSFGRWIRKRRGALGLTRAALAQRVAYSAAMVRKIENDERQPSPHAAALLAAALEIPPDQRDAFLEAARQERAVDHLGSPVLDEPFAGQAPAQPRTNLPVPPTLFVGRGAEQARLARLLEDPACRLVSLVGLAGIGKTRLAVQAAYGQLERFPQGVYFVALAPLSSPTMLVSAIAQTLGVHLHEAADPQVELQSYLRVRHMLLVLDNFEHPMEGADVVAALMQAAPSLKLLVTSRERLNLLGEWVFKLTGLPFPPVADDSPAEPLESYGAVQLFLQSALRVHPGFNLNEDNWRWVARICQVTEGLPLAVELAAAWVPVLSCQAIAQEIETNLDFLKASMRALPERHRSLRATLDHSWRLLSAREQACLRRFSVFHGGFDRAAAQAVAGAGLDDLASLLNKSLLKRVGEDRFDLHELVRQYAAGHLQSDPSEEAQTHDWHSRCFAARCRAWGEVMAGPRQSAVLAEMATEMDNVQQAWSWMIAHQHLDQLQQSLRALWFFHEFQGRYQAGAGLLAQAAAGLSAPAAPDTMRSAVLGQVMAKLGYFYGHVGRYDEARTLFKQSLSLLQPSGDQAALADTLAYLGHMHLRLGDFPEARGYVEQSLALHRALDNSLGIVFALVTLSFIAQSGADHEQAYQFASEGLVICRDVLGFPQGTANSLIALSTAAAGLGRYAEAEHWAHDSLHISQALNNRWGIGQILRLLGSIHLAQGHAERAEDLFRQSLAQFRDIGDRPFMAWALLDLGRAARASGDNVAAQRAFSEGLQLAQDTKSHVIVQKVSEELAAVNMEA